jgi:hypothetical protein
MADKNKFKKTWIILFGIAGVLFFFVGIAKLFADREILDGVQYLSTSVLYWVYLSLIRRDKVNPTDTKKPFALGFIFATVGLNINIGVWGLGMVLLLFGLAGKKKK